MIGALTATEMLQKMATLQPVLASAGIPAAVMPYAIAQVMHESDDLNSSLAKDYNNYSGVKYYGQKLAKQGRKAPDGDYYAMYNSANDWAKDYANILAKNAGAGRPLDATNAKDFVDRLRANNYFSDPYYHVKYNAKLRKVQEAINLYKPGAGTAIIQYQGTAGNPTKQAPIITPATQTVTYANDPTGRVNADGTPKGLTPFPDLSKQTIESLWDSIGTVGKIGAAILAVIVVKKLLD